MKIVFGSTKEQDDTIDQLLMYVRNAILPLYTKEEELLMYDSMGLLQFDYQRNLYNGTMKEAFQVMVALQTLISIIENKETYDSKEYEKYNERFNVNVDILNYFGLFFPFDFQYFKKVDARHLLKNVQMHISTQYHM